MDAAISEATGLLRNVRRVPLGKEDNFVIKKSDSVASMLIDNLAFIAIAATIIGLITLLGAAIALMNILLVQVSERTREIGVSKAIGARAINIRTMFLVESSGNISDGWIVGYCARNINGQSGILADAQPVYYPLGMDDHGGHYLSCGRYFVRSLPRI